MGKIIKKIFSKSPKNNKQEPQEQDGFPTHPDRDLSGAGGMAPVEDKKKTL